MADLLGQDENEGVNYQGPPRNNAPATLLEARPLAISASASQPARPLHLWTWTCSTRTSCWPPMPKPSKTLLSDKTSRLFLACDARFNPGLRRRDAGDLRVAQPSPAMPGTFEFAAEPPDKCEPPCATRGQGPFSGQGPFIRAKAHCLWWQARGAQRVGVGEIPAGGYGSRKTSRMT
jgi:hypothetical protein